MTSILRNTNLATGKSPIQGWETCAASGGAVAIYTGNFFGAYSTDAGATFQTMDPEGICNVWGESLCCDQVVIYIPRIDNFAWLMQTRKGNYVLALATPGEVVASKGRAWNSYLIPADRFGLKNATADYPEIAVGDSYLYLTCNISSGRAHSIALRLSLAELFARKPLHLIYFSTTDKFWLRPAQATLETGYFAAQNSASELIVYSWPETSDHIDSFSVGIATIPNEDFTVKTPDDDDWLGPTSKVDWHLYGATRSGSRLWLAWNGARRVSGRSTNSFNYPHIGIAVIDLKSRKLVEQRYIWNPDHAFAWPALATNIDGDVGLSFCWGGNRTYPQHGVGMLTGSSQSFVSTTSGTTKGAGGHYTSVRDAYPNVSTFCASGFNQLKKADGDRNDPHYVLFGA